MGSDKGRNDSGQQSLEDIWASEDPIFARKELLDIDHVPDEERIIGRDEEIENVASSIHPAIRGKSPRNTLIYGKTGTGKSLVAKHVTRSAQQYAQKNKTNLGRVYVDCTQTTTETRVVVTLARGLNDSDKTDISIPVAGLSTDVYYDRLWNILDQMFDVVIIILDEIDKLQDGEILMQLSRAGEAGKIENCKLGIIAISNKISFKETLDERILSSLQDREFIFPPYDANQLRSILQNRADAFHGGVLTGDVIPLSAAFAAQEHGDARKALDILRNAGELARDEDTEKVHEYHVRNAREKADMDRFSKLLKDQPSQAKAAVYALSVLTNREKETEEFSTREIYEMYDHVAREIDLDVISHRRISDRLNELVFLDVLGSTERVGRGRAKGVTNYYHLLEDPIVVQKAIHQDSRFDELDNIEL